MALKADPPDAVDEGEYGPMEFVMKSPEWIAGIAGVVVVAGIGLFLGRSMADLVQGTLGIPNENASEQAQQALGTKGGGL